MVAEIDAAGELLQRWERFNFGDPGFPTAREISQAGRPLGELPNQHVGRVTSDAWHRLGRSETPVTRIVGAEAGRIYNDMHRQWALERGVDPAEDPEFLRAFRERIGQDPESGLYIDPE
jgi:hypothetical protein